MAAHTSLPCLPVDDYIHRFQQTGRRGPVELNVYGHMCVCVCGRACVHVCELACVQACVCHVRGAGGVDLCLIAGDPAGDTTERACTSWKYWFPAHCYSNVLSI